MADNTGGICVVYRIPTSDQVQSKVAFYRTCPPWDR